MISAKQEVILFLIQLFEQKKRGVVLRIAITKKRNCKCNCYKKLSQSILLYEISLVSSVFMRLFKKMCPLFWRRKKTESYNPIASSFVKFCLLNSSDEWTYRSSVILGVECPKTSLSDLISNPTSTHLVANVCLNTWKCMSSMPHAALYFFYVVLHYARLDGFDFTACQQKRIHCIFS